MTKYEKIAAGIILTGSLLSPLIAAVLLYKTGTIIFLLISAASTLLLGVNVRSANSIQALANQLESIFE